MTVIPIDLLAERLVRRASDELLAIRDGECVVCYVNRMVAAFGCNTNLRFARHFRDARAPRATAIERRFGQVGGYCDCEILMNGWSPHPRFWTPARETEEDGIVFCDDPRPPDPPPPCGTVRRGSIRPCGNWVRHTYGFGGI